MLSITLESNKLRRERPAAIRRLVSPLLPTPPNLAVERVGLRRDIYTLTVLPRGRSPTFYSAPETALVSTAPPRILLNYYENWKQYLRVDEYFLDRMYMHLHIVATPTPRQVFSLHCDPALESGEVHYSYKRGPHLHIEGASPDISRAHISPCLTDVTLGGNDLAAIMDGFGKAVRMVVSEILPCINR